jgi:hypothetical protein
LAVRMLVLVVTLVFVRHVRERTRSPRREHVPVDARVYVAMDQGPVAVPDANRGQALTLPPRPPRRCRTAARCDEWSEWLCMGCGGMGAEEFVAARPLRSAS